MSRGLLITFEGGEACGKSTQVALLAERFRSQGQVCRALREPGGTPLGERLRQLVKQDPDGQGMAAETELLLMNASRAELVRRIIVPALDDGEIVLCDRFYDSTVAYQQFGRGLDQAVVGAVISAAVGSLKPDLTFWLRVPTTEAKRRLTVRDDRGDRFEAEQAAFFERVEAGYTAISAAEPKRFYPVEGVGEPKEVHQRIWSLVESLLDLNLREKC